MRLVTQRFDAGYLSTMPVIADSAGYHNHGNRDPYNGVFIGGEARVLKPGDGDFEQP